MVSLFGLKFKGGKKKAIRQEKPSLLQSPWRQEQKVENPELFAPSLNHPRLFRGGERPESRPNSVMSRMERPGTGMSMRSAVGMVRPPFYALDGTTSMLDFGTYNHSRCSSLAPSISELRMNASSTDLRHRFGPQGSISSIESRPGTSAGRERLAVGDTLELPFSKDSSTSKAPLRGHSPLGRSTTLEPEANSETVQAVERSPPKSSSPLHKKKASSTSLGDPRRGLPSPPHSLVDGVKPSREEVNLSNMKRNTSALRQVSHASEGGDDADHLGRSGASSPIFSQGSMTTGQQRPAPLPSPASSDATTRDNDAEAPQWAMPVIQTVQSRRDTIRVETPRQPSITMNIEELGKSPFADFKFSWDEVASEAKAEEKTMPPPPPSPPTMAPVTRLPSPPASREMFRANRPAPLQLNRPTAKPELTIVPASAGLGISAQERPLLASETVARTPTQATLEAFDMHTPQPLETYQDAILGSTPPRSPALPDLRGRQMHREAVRSSPQTANRPPHSGLRESPAQDAHRAPAPGFRPSPLNEREPRWNNEPQRPVRSPTEGLGLRPGPGARGPNMGPPPAPRGAMGPPGPMRSPLPPMSPLPPRTDSRGPPTGPLPSPNPNQMRPTIRAVYDPTDRPHPSPGPARPQYGNDLDYGFTFPSPKRLDFDFSPAPNSAPKRGAPQLSPNEASGSTPSSFSNSSNWPLMAPIPSPSLSLPTFSAPTTPRLPPHGSSPPGRSPTGARVEDDSAVPSPLRLPLSPKPVELPPLEPPPRHPLRPASPSPSPLAGGKTPAQPKMGKAPPKQPNDLLIGSRMMVRPTGMPDRYGTAFI